MKNFRKKGLAWLLAAVLVLPGTPVMAEAAAEPAETEQPAEPDRTEKDRFFGGRRGGSRRTDGCRRRVRRSR